MIRGNGESEDGPAPSARPRRGCRGHCGAAGIPRTEIPPHPPDICQRPIPAAVVRWQDNERSVNQKSIGNLTQEGQESRRDAHNACSSIEYGHILALPVW